MRGHKFHYPPQRGFIARCSVNDCGCVWLNLALGWLRVWPLRSVCWGRWLPKRIAGECFRAGTEG